MDNLTGTIAIVLSLATTTCQTDLDINNLIDQNSPFTLTIRTVDTETGLSTNETEEIEVKSEKWNNLVDFAKNNMDGWESSPASYIGDIYVSQGHFRLIYTRGSDGVIIKFTNKNDESKQYSRQIDKRELDFLTE